jgi:energy-converting hydrogenase Eha subunit C
VVTSVIAIQIDRCGSLVLLVGQAGILQKTHVIVHVLDTIAFIVKVVVMAVVSEEGLSVERIGQVFGFVPTVVSQVVYFIDVGGSRVS